MKKYDNPKTKLKKTAIIPARAGSKGLPDKNIADLCGKPLMAYTIEAAVESGCFDSVIVSSDSGRYLETAVEYGATGMLRPAELAGDNVSTFAVIEHLLSELDTMPDYFALLQPTSPLRTADHIKDAVSVFEANYDDFDFLSSVVRADKPAVLVRPVGQDMSMKYFDEDYSDYRRQDYRDYSPNGAVYLAKPGAYLEQKHFYGERSLAYLMDKTSSVDIDDYIDLELAGLLIRTREGQL